MDILKQIEAKTKGFDIIDSCYTTIQLSGAKRYVELYYNLFEDLIGKSELEIYLIDKHEEIVNNGRLDLI